MKNKLFKVIFVIAASLLFSGSLFSQEESEKLKSTSEVVLTNEDFVKNNCENVGDALKTITGVYVNSEGDISLRDVSSSKVVVILDGQRLNTPGSIGVNVAALPIENIEKIELLRGGRSAQYGADAVGGVILITSKSKQKTDKSLMFGTKLTYGSYDRRILNLTNSFNINNLNAFLSFRREMWDGDFEYRDYNDHKKRLINNQQSSFNIFFKTDLNINEGKNLSISGNWYKANNGTSGMIDNLTPNAKIRFDNKSYNLTYDQNRSFHDFSLKAQGYFLDFETKFDNPDAFGGAIHSDHDNYAIGLELSQAGNLGKYLNLSYGYSLRNDRISSTDVGKKHRNTNSAHSSLSLSFPLNVINSQMEASLALRYDAPSDFQSALSPRLSIMISHGENISISLISHISESYKAPSFNDLYWPQDAFAVGNPDLIPETGINWDAGISLKTDKLSTAVNYFRNDIDNLILWAQDPEVNNLWTPKNISKTSTKGIETSLTWNFLDNLFIFNVEYTYMVALNKGPDPNRHNKYIIYRPKNKLDLTGTFHFAAFEWNIIYHYTGIRYTNPANTGWLPAYNTIDTNLVCHFDIRGIRHTVTLEASNITNESYMKVLGTAEPGSMYKISVGNSF